MPPKTHYTKDDVLDAAIQVIQEYGLSSLSARRIATKLESSTAPVYHHYDSMDKLTRDVLLKAKDLLFDYALRSYSDRVFLNLGMGTVLFARDQRQLFRALFLECGEFRDILDEILRQMRQEMDKDPRAALMSPEAKDAFLNQMFIFTYGLGTLVCVELIPDRSDENIRRILETVGAVILKSVTPLIPLPCESKNGV